MITSKKFVGFLAIWSTFLSFFDVFGIVYEEIALYIDMYAFLKIFNDKRSMFPYYDEVLLIFEEIVFYTFSV